MLFSSHTLSKEGKDFIGWLNTFETLKEKSYPLHESPLDSGIDLPCKLKSLAFYSLK